MKREVKHEYDAFLSHKQITGRDVARLMFMNFSELGLTCFLDVADDFELHDLEANVRNSKFMLAIVTPWYFESYWCRKGRSPPAAVTFFPNGPVRLRMRSREAGARSRERQWTELSRLSPPLFCAGRTLLGHKEPSHDRDCRARRGGLRRASL